MTKLRTIKPKTTLSAQQVKASITVSESGGAVGTNGVAGMVAIGVGAGLMGAAPADRGEAAQAAASEALSIKTSKIICFCTGSFS